MNFYYKTLAIICSEGFSQTFKLYINLSTVPLLFFRPPIKSSFCKIALLRRFHSRDFLIYPSMIHLNKIIRHRFLGSAKLNAS